MLYSSNPVHLLIIEDNPGDADLFETFFRQDKRKCRFEIVTDGEEAIRIIRSFEARAGSERPDLIFLDINIPKSDGKEVLSCIRSLPILKTTPVIVLTSSDNEKDIQTCYEKGANCVLTKAYDLKSATELFGTLETFWVNTVSLVNKQE